jgi:DNA-binding response OmpR family regulator
LAEVRSQARALIVDDEPGVCAVLGQALSMNYIICDQATSATRAWDLRTRRVDSVALIDKNMPEQTGLDLLERMEAARIACARVMMTAYPSVETIAQAFRAGVCDYIEKPFEDIFAVSTRVQNIIEQQVGEEFKKRIADILLDFMRRGGEFTHTTARLSRVVVGLDDQREQEDQVGVVVQGLAKADEIHQALIQPGVRVTKYATVDDLLHDPARPPVVVLALAVGPVQAAVTALSTAVPASEVIAVGDESADSSSSLAAVLDCISAGATDFALPAMEGVGAMSSRVRRAVDRAYDRRLYARLLVTLRKIAQDQGLESAAEAFDSVLTPLGGSRGETAEPQVTSEPAQINERDFATVLERLVHRTGARAQD